MDELRIDEKDPDLKKGVGALKDDRKRHCFFLLGAEIDVEASEAGGMFPDSDEERAGQYRSPIFRDVVMFSVKDPDGKDVTCRTSTLKDQRENPEAWARFERVRGMTPIIHLPGASPCVVETAHANRIGTVQALAETDPNTLPELLRPFVLRAQQYLMILSGGKPRIRLQAA